MLFVIRNITLAWFIAFVPYGAAAQDAEQADGTAEAEQSPDQGEAGKSKGRTEKKKAERLGPVENASKLLQEAVSEDPLVVYSAIKGLGEQPYWSVPVQETLIASIEHSDPVVRLMAVRGLVQFHRRPQDSIVFSKEAKAALVKGRPDRFTTDELRTNAVTALMTVLDLSNPDNSNYETRGLAVELLGKIRNSEDGEDLEGLITSMFIEYFFEERSFHVRSWVLDAFKDPTYQPNNTEVELLLGDVALDEEADDRERIAALDYLVERKPIEGSEARLKAFLKAAQADDFQLRLKGIEGLAYMTGSEEAAEAIKDRLFNDPAVYVRYFAARYYHALTGDTGIAAILPEAKDHAVGPQMQKLLEELATANRKQLLSRKPVEAQRPQK